MEGNLKTTTHKHAKKIGKKGSPPPLKLRRGRKEVMKMSRKSALLRQYGIWVKLGLGCLIFICLGGLNAITFIKEVNATSNLPNHNNKLGEWNRPPTYVGSEFEDWKSRKESAQKEIDDLVAVAEAKRGSYGDFEYFSDYARLMDIEDKYNFYITAPGLIMDHMVRLRDCQRNHSVPKLTKGQEAFVASVQSRISKRQWNTVPQKPEPITFTQLVQIIFGWLWSKYLLLALFWLLVYIIRFEERTRSMERYQEHHHEKNIFFEAKRPFPGQLSLKDELIICPWRFVSRVVFWPFYFRAYPHFENTAEGTRYVRAKARLLQGRSMFYQPTSAEDAWLRQEARKPVAEFEKTLKALSEIEVPHLVKKSLFTAYLSLVFGVLLQPAIALAAGHSDKAAKYFYGGQVQLVQVQHNQHQLDGPGPPSHDFQPDAQAVLPSPIDLQPVFNLLLKIAVEFWKRLPIVVFDIDHVPLTSLV